MRYSFSQSYSATKCVNLGNFFNLTKKQCHTHVSWVWWRYLFRSRVYSYLSEIGPASFEHFYAPFRKWVEIFTFFDNYYIHLAENISAVVWFRLGEKPRTSRKSRFWTNFKWRKIFPGGNEIGDSHFVLIEPRITGILNTWVYDKRFRSYESFRVRGRYSATYGPIWLRLW